MTRLEAERGTAMLAALSIALIVLPVGAFVAFQARTDWQIEHNLHWEIEAFYVADAGVEHALADIGPRVSYDALLNGPDGVAGTGDDGIFPFAEGTPSDFPQSPLRYDVRVERAGTGLIRLTSQGAGTQQAIKVIQALVAPAPLPFTPAALYADGDVASLDLGYAGFLLSGLDHGLTDPPATASGTAAALPALTTSSASAESVLRAQLASSLAGQLVGAGMAPSMATSAPLDVHAYAMKYAAAAGAVPLSAGVAAGDVVLGSAAAPQISVVNGDWTVAGHLTGNGVLVVQGTLQVTGQLTFAGLVVVSGALMFQESSDVRVNGTLWRAPAQDARLLFAGRGAITYSSAALAAVDAALAGLLPHASVIVGWQEPL